MRSGAVSGQIRVICVATGIADDDTSSLPRRPERRRIHCVQILLVPMASCAHVPRPPSKSQNGDLHRPMAWFPGAYVRGPAHPVMGTCTLRVWGAAGRGCHTPAWPGSAHCVRSSYVKCALFGISTPADRWPPCLEGDFGDPGETFREAPSPQ